MLHSICFTTRHTDLIRPERHRAVEFTNGLNDHEDFIAGESSFDNGLGAELTGIKSLLLISGHGCYVFPA